MNSIKLFTLAITLLATTLLAFAVVNSNQKPTPQIGTAQLEIVQ